MSTSNDTVGSLLTTPSQVSAVICKESGALLVGCGDGSVRAYHPPGKSVIMAIRGLDGEVSSLASARTSRGKEDGGRVWVASGIRVILFDFDSEKLVLSTADALEALQLGEDNEDVLNEVTINSSGKTLAFSTDGGSVGVVDLSSKHVRRMKTKHTNICGCVSFIPERHSEFVSGGYDSAILHFNFTLGNILSRKDFTSAPPSAGISLSPPFIQCISISKEAVIAAGTADGQLWISHTGQVSRVKTGAARPKKWQGLSEEHAKSVKIAEGPIVAVKFLDDTTILTCTLLGVLSAHKIADTHDTYSHTLQLLWTTQAAEELSKVNTVAVTDDLIIIGGLDIGGKGVVSLLSREQLDTATVAVSQEG